MVNYQVKFGIILSYLQIALGVIIGLLYTPFMISTLGKSEYGLFNTVSSTISMLSVLNLGFNAGYIRYYSIFKADEDLESIKKLNGLFALVFSIIGIISLIIGLYCSMNLELFFADGLTLKEYSLAKKLFVLFTICTSISFPMSVFSIILSAQEKFIFLKSVGLLRTILIPILSIFLLLYGFGSIGMVCVTLIVSLVSDVIIAYYCISVYKCEFSLKNTRFNLFKDIFIFTSFIAINIIVDQINWNVDKILLARYKGTSSVAVYTVGFTIYMYYQQLSTSISSFFTPRIHRIINLGLEENILNKELTSIMLGVGRLQLFFLGLVLSGFVIFGEYFLVNIWAGRDYVESYFVTILLMLPATIALIQNIGIEVQRAKNKHQFRSISYFIMAIFNVAISVVLCQKYGAVGAALGTAVSLLIANGIVMNIYYQRNCGVNIIRFWKGIMPMALTIVLLCLVFFGIQVNILYDNHFEFLTNILFYAMIYVLIVSEVGFKVPSKIISKITG